MLPSSIPCMLLRFNNIPFDLVCDLKECEFVVHTGCLLALLAPPCMYLLSTFHLLPPLICMCLLCLYHTVSFFFKFLSFHYLHCFSVLPFFPSSSLPYFSCHSFLCLITHSALLLTLSFACSRSPTLCICLHFSVFSLLFPVFTYSHILHPPLPFLNVLPGRVADACLPGFWGAAGVCNDHGKTYALYAITVVRRNQDGSEDCWKTYRRYSDFHDFHMRITEQVCACVS